MSQSTVDQLLDLIDQLPEGDRIALEKRLAERLDSQWKSAVAEGQRHAAERGIDDDRIDRAIHRRRYGE